MSSLYYNSVVVAYNKIKIINILKLAENNLRQDLKV